MNGTNIFLVKMVDYHPTPDACLHGITRGLVIEIARENAIEVEERNISLTELYAADEAFGTGSMGELTPIIEVDEDFAKSGRLTNDSGTNKIV